jgi:hypothetical protein
VISAAVPRSIKRDESVRRWPSAGTPPHRFRHCHRITPNGDASRCAVTEVPLYSPRHGRNRLSARAASSRTMATNNSADHQSWGTDRGRHRTALGGRLRKNAVSSALPNGRGYAGRGVSRLLRCAHTGPRGSPRRLHLLLQASALPSGLSGRDPNAAQARFGRADAHRISIDPCAVARLG